LETDLACPCILEKPKYQGEKLLARKRTVLNSAYNRHSMNDNEIRIISKGMLRFPRVSIRTPIGTGVIS
jgi:hypothetical protein